MISVKFVSVKRKMAHFSFFGDITHQRPKIWCKGKKVKNIKRDSEQEEKAMTKESEELASMSNLFSYCFTL